MPKDVPVMTPQMHSPYKQTTTFQNLVHNEHWTEHQPTKNISFRHHIEFGFLTEGQYIASRVVLDDGAIKNFIKTSQTKIKGILNAKQFPLKHTLTKTMKTGYISTGNQVEEKPL